MKAITVYVADDELEDLEKIFFNEKDFKPQVRQDFIIINLLKQLVLNSKKPELCINRESVT